MSHYIKKTNKYENYCVSDYGSFYEIMFEGFDDCDSEETNSEEDQTEKESESKKSENDELKPVTFTVPKGKFGNEANIEVEVFKDENDDVNYRSNGKITDNKTKQSFLVIAALAEMFADKKEKFEIIEKLIALDGSSKNYSLPRAKQIIKQKIQTSRFGYTLDDIKKTLGL